MAILQDTSADTAALIAQLRAENAKLRANASGKAGKLKVSEKGALSLYGLGRFPVTLYKQQWLAVLDDHERIRAYIEAHDSELKNKDD